MKCLQARELFQEYLDKHISAEKRSQLEEHLLNCPSCQKELKEWEILFSDIQILTEEKPVPAGLTKSIMSHIQAEKITAKQSWIEKLKHIFVIPRFSLRWVSAAAVALTVMIFFVNFIWLSPEMLPEGLTEVQFSLRAGGEQPTSVAVVGDFNDWNPSKNLLKDENSDGIWSLTLNLEPGRYEYMFIIDGQKWVPDPEAYRYVRDGFGNKNAVIEISNCS